MARTLILNISASSQTLPAAYGGHAVAVGHGRVVDVESSLVVAGMGGFEAMDGVWAVSAISTDTALGDIDVAAGGVALLASFVGGGGGGGGPVNWADILNKPAFANVATSGSYEDLSDRPALADVAESGLYSDLAGTPDIPVASNTAATTVSTTAAAGVLSTYARGDHQHAHGSLAGGTLHSAATTVAAGFMSAADKSKLDAVPASFALVASSGAYGDLSGTPTLAAVATSGSADDLADQPYDLMVSSPGELAVGAVVMEGLAPRDLVFTQIQQGGGATVKLVVNGVDAVYPQAVSAGALLKAEVTSAGVKNYFTLTGKVA